MKTVAAITRFPVTRLQADTEAAFTAAADLAFRKMITTTPGAAGLMFSKEDAAPLVLDVSKKVSVSYDPLLCRCKSVNILINLRMSSISNNIELGLPHGSMFTVSEVFPQVFLLDFGHFKKVSPPTSRSQFFLAPVNKLNRLFRAKTRLPQNFRMGDLFEDFHMPRVFFVRGVSPRSQSWSGQELSRWQQATPSMAAPPFWSSVWVAGLWSSHSTRDSALDSPGCSSKFHRAPSSTFWIRV